MPQLYAQTASRPDPWLIGRTSAGLCTLQTACPLTVTYSGGSPTADTIAAGSAATVYGGSATSFDASADVWVVLTVPASGALQVVKEALLSTVVGDWAGLARIVQHAVEPYQPQAYLGAGGAGGTGGATTSTPLASSASARALSLWNGSSNNSAPSSWYTSGFDDSAWSAAVVATIQVGETQPPGADPIWPTANPAANTEKALFRQHVTLPSTPIASASVLLAADDAPDSVYINGTALTLIPGTYSFGPGAAIAVPVGLLVPGGDNVLAAEASNALASHAWIAYSLTVITSRGAGGAVEGDLLYYHDGAWIDLPIGSSGQELTVVSGDPAWTDQPAGGGTVTSVNVAVPAPLASSGGPITASGTITLAWSSGQTANRVLATPNGTTGAVGLRALVTGDIPSLPASQITSGQLAAARGGTGVDGSSAAGGTLLIGNGSGYALATLTAGSGISVVNSSGGISIAATGGGGSGTVTSVTLTVPGVLAVSGSPITTSGTLAVTLATQSAATVFAGPATGSAAAPTFRALQGSDLPAAAAAGGHIHAHGHFI